jgi:hypothetical protein
MILQDGGDLFETVARRVQYMDLGMFRQIGDQRSDIGDGAVDDINSGK